MTVAVAKVATGATVDVSTTATCSFASLPSAGSAIIAVASIYHGNTGGVTVTAADNQGGSSYSVGLRDFRNNSGATQSLTSAVLYRENISAPSGTFTITFTGLAGNYWRVGAIEVTGLAATPLDVTSSNGATSSSDPITAPTSGTSAATSVADSILIGVITPSSDSANTGGATPAGFTTITNSTDSSSHQTGNGCYKILSATGTQLITWGNFATAGASGNWAAVEVVLKGSAGGGATTRGTPFGHEGTAFAGGRTFHGILQRSGLWLPRPRNSLRSVMIPTFARG